MTEQRLTREERTAMEKQHNLFYASEAVRRDQTPLTLGVMLAMAAEDEDDLTEDERHTLSAYLRHREEVEARRRLLGLVDLADVMEHGSNTPEMLVLSQLVRGEHHLIYGQKESAKTWLLLMAAWRVMANGGTVLWVDKEMGQRNLADRFDSLGVPVELVREFFVYCEFPSMDGSQASRDMWGLLLEAREPDLIVVDAQTEVLADAGLNENLGTDVARWMGWYLEPARRMGAATVFLDHVGHDSSGRAVSSRQKGAAAKIELEVVKAASFDRETVGEVKVTLTKNTVSAPVPEEQRFAIGGTPFRLSEITTNTLPEYPSDEAMAQVHISDTLSDRTLNALERVYPEGLSFNKLREQVRGSNDHKRDAVLRLVETGRAELRRVGPNRDQYFFVPPPEAEAGSDTPARPRLTKAEKIERARSMVATGSSYEEIAETMAVKERTVRGWLA